jgi:hypothetical protein
MNVRPCRAVASFASIGLALALAGCAGGPGAPLESNLSPPSGPPKFVQTNGANVAFAEFKNSAFPYRGLIPPSEDNDKARPFLDVNDGGRLGHLSPRGGLLWEDTTYNDRHVLFAVGNEFDPNRPGTLVVFFHGNQATLTRDVVERQQTARQLAQSNLNGVLVAPQLAVDAADSSAGNFWRPGAFAQFLDEAEAKLADLYPNASRAAFRRMPVVIVAYSGGYMPAAYSLAQGGADGRIRGVVLFDALYGEEDKFAHWVEGARYNAFFVSAYSSSSRDRNVSLRARLERDGVAVQSGLPDGLRPGIVAFIDSGDVRHEDFVNAAWTSDPLREVLSRVVQ